MILELGRRYRVTIITKRRKMSRSGSYTRPMQRGWDSEVLKLTLEYCGGSVVDKDGHHVGGGVWSHAMLDHRGPQYCDLNVLHIQPLSHHWWEELPVHGGPDRDRVVTTLSNLPYGWLFRTALRRKKKGKPYMTLLHEIWRRTEWDDEAATVHGIEYDGAFKVEWVVHCLYCLLSEPEAHVPHDAKTGSVPGIDRFI